MSQFFGPETANMTLEQVGLFPVWKLATAKRRPERFLELRFWNRRFVSATPNDQHRQRQPSAEPRGALTYVELATAESRHPGME